MRHRTLSVLFVVSGALVALALVGLGFFSGGELTERWVSETPRDNEFNHHAVGVGPEGEVIVAPVAEVPNSDVPITNTSCALVRLTPENGSSVWRTGMPSDDCFTHALTEPAIEDIDSDGELEVVVSSTEDAVIAYSAESGTEEWRAPLHTYGYGRPTIANVSSALGPEVVTSDIRGGVVVVHGNGTIAWRFGLNETHWSTPSVWQAPIVDDFDADGSPEIFIGSSRGPLLLSANGTVDWQHNGSATYTATAQVDDDSAIEMFTAGTSSIRAYDGRTGEREWQRNLTNARVQAAADADDDGRVELYAGRVGGIFLALDARSGETEWSTTISEGDDTIVPPPVLGDINGDARPELVGVLNSGTVVVLDPTTGTEMAFYERNVPIWTFPSVHEINNNGTEGILVRYGDGRVVMLAYSS
jgi:outer membrane protein assembly factor BamB